MISNNLLSTKYTLILSTAHKCHHVYHKQLFHQFVLLCINSLHRCLMEFQRYYLHMLGIASSLFLIILSVSANFVNLLFHVPEHVEPGHVVGILLQSINLKAPIQSLTFESPSANWSQLFHIETTTGIIRTTKVSRKLLDRETICPANDENIMFKQPKIISNECQISILISINQRILVSVDIIIDDINDNPPFFIKNGQRLSELYFIFPEDAIINETTVTFPTAVDPDEESQQLIKYDLIGEFLPFRLGSVDRFQLYLQVSDVLDFEKTPFYKFILQSCESDQNGDSSPQCSSTHVHVEIKNVNDHHPIFLSSNYTTTVSEDAPVGTTVLIVKATDNDSEPFGNISYYLPEILNLPFVVDGFSGKIIVSHQKKTQRQYTFAVYASDDPRALSQSEEIIDSQVSELRNFASTIVNIYVVDVNNHKPIIDIRHAINTSSTEYITFSKYPRTPFIVELAEERTSPVILAYLTVTDLDEGENAQCTCQITSLYMFSYLSKFNLTQVNQLTQQVAVYRLIAIEPIDAENDDIQRNLISADREDRCKGVVGFLKVPIECSDAGRSTLKTVDTIYIALKDLNEFPTYFVTNLKSNERLNPKDDELVFQVNVFENATLGTTILTLTANDNDAGNCLKYSLNPNYGDASYITVGNYSGDVILKKTFDYEEISTVSFQVFVNENSPFENSNLATASVVIHVQNTNDNEPRVFSPQPVSKKICKQIKQPLSRFSKDYFNQSIIADSVDCFVLNINEEISINSVVGRLEARDVETPNRTSFTYNIIDVFVPRIDRGPVHPTRLVRKVIKLDSKGEIRVVGRLDREEFEWVDLIFSVSDDDSTNPQYSVGILHAQLIDINDNAPVWQFPSSDDYHISVSINARVGSVVSRVQASDADSGSIKYVISPKPVDIHEAGVSQILMEELHNTIYGAEYFDMDETTGKLLTKKLFSNSSHLSFRLDLIASDTGDPIFSTITHLIILLSKEPFTELPYREVVNYPQNDGVQLIDPLIPINPATDAVQTNSQFENLSDTWVQLIGIITGACALFILIGILSFIYCKRTQGSSRSLTAKTSFALEEQEDGKTWIPLHEKEACSIHPMSFTQARSRPISSQTNRIDSVPVITLPAGSIAFEDNSCGSMAALGSGLPIFVSVAVLSDDQGSHQMYTTPSELVFVSEASNSKIESLYSKSSWNENIEISQSHPHRLNT